jgi:hypothetical protein
MTQLSGYMGNPNLSRLYEVHNLTQEQVDEYLLCSDPITGPIYFIKKYIKIVSVDKGVVPFEMWDFQEDIIEKVNNNRFVICKMARQSGKSTTLLAYLLWYVLYNQNVSIAILANKGSTARELLGRLQFAYEFIPKWMQQGIATWNKSYLELANGSKILAESTSSGSVRGRSFNIVMLDEFAFVQNNLAIEFFQSTFPTISSGSTTKVLIVSTPNGMNLFYKMWKDAIDGKNDYVPIDVNWRKVPGRDEKFKELMIRNTSPEQFEQEFECEFLGSSHTLISGAILKLLTWDKPIATDFKDEYGQLDIYDNPIPNHTYVISCDVSRGQGLDYQAFSVIDVTKIPYIQVAKYRNNKLPALVYPNIIERTGKLYNNAFVLVEINDIGQQVVDILHYELSYENLLKLAIKGKQGQNISAGYKKQIQFGVRTTTPVKRIGCSNLKALVESKKLIIKDFDTISELTTFVATKESFAAEEGTNDDIVMSLVIFGWLVNQKVFKESIETDVRRVLEMEQTELMDDDYLPAPIISNGLEAIITIDQNGDIWSEVSKEEMIDKMRLGMF